MDSPSLASLEAPFRYCTSGRWAGSPFAACALAGGDALGEETSSLANAEASLAVVLYLLH